MRLDSREFRRWIPMLVALGLAALFNSWVLSPKHFFFADDWGWLMRAEFLPWRESIHLLPTSIYNDRPGGELIIRLMYQAFWLRPGPFNLLWLLIHLCNCGVYFVVVSRQLPPVRAMLATILVGCWFSTLTAVQWVGAVFDLTVVTWCLLTLYCYIKATEVRRHAWLPALAALALHFLAIRTKELALAMIVVLAAWDFLLLRNADLWVRLRRLLPHVLLTLVFLVIYARLYTSGKQMLDSGVYAISLTPATIMDGVGYYFAQAFYAFVPGLNVTNIAAGLVFAALVALLACTSRFGLASLVSAAALCAAVLLLAKQRHPLYLYAPHFFVAAVICSVSLKSRWATAATSISVAALLAWPAYTGYWRDARNFVLVKGGYSQTLFYDYADLMKSSAIPGRVRVAISDPYFDPFSWGPGSAIQIYHKKQDIRVDVESLTTMTTAGCADSGTVCLVEADGRLRRDQ